MDELLNRIWSHLEAGANAGAKRSPFTMLQAATTGVDGAPKVRTVVLRQVARERYAVSFHTDVRSEKVAELRRDARIALVACDYEAGVQIRLEGMAMIVDDPDERLAVWNSSRPRTLILYRAPLRPGTPVESPSQAYAPSGTVEAGQMAGFENFCLVSVILTKIEFLDLSSHEGHVRKLFTRDGDEWRGGWIAP